MYYTHINRNIIQRNRNEVRRGGVAEPPIRIQEGKNGEPTYCQEVLLPAGSRMLYRAAGDPILPCGARLVIVSETQPEVVA